ncbi:MAG: hypothetical protein ACTTI5_01155 [Treponema sp.]
MCWKCGKNIEAGTQIFRNSECPECKSDLHSCRNCKFYESGAHYDCKESVDFPVNDKERANFCDYFSVRFDFSSNAKKNDKIDAARNAFNNLFG